MFDRTVCNINKSFAGYERITDIKAFIKFGYQLKEHRELHGPHVTVIFHKRRRPVTVHDTDYSLPSPVSITS